MSGAADRNSPIVFMDSGIGGLPYLERARELLPEESFAYLADNAGFPYGGKSSAEIRAIVLDRVGRLVRHRPPKALVIACNTASQVALFAVRQANPGLCVIGTVPAVKPAAASSLTRVIGVMATERTVRDPYMDSLVERHCQGCAVVRIAAAPLVDFVEGGLESAPAEARQAAVEPFVRALIDSGADRIVLACTHFLHLADDIAAVALRLGGAGIEVVDSREGVARRLIQVLKEKKPGRETRTRPGEPGWLMLTGKIADAAAYSRRAEKYGLRGVIHLED